MQNEHISTRSHVPRCLPRRQRVEKKTPAAELRQELLFQADLRLARPCRMRLARQTSKLTHTHTHTHTHKHTRGHAKHQLIHKPRQLLTIHSEFCSLRVTGTRNALQLQSSMCARLTPNASHSIILRPSDRPTAKADLAWPHQECLKPRSTAQRSTAGKTCSSRRSSI